MTITSVGTAQTTATPVGQITFAVPAGGVPSGQTLFVSVGWQDPASGGDNPVCTDSAGNTYVRDVFASGVFGGVDDTRMAHFRASDNLALTEGQTIVVSGLGTNFDGDRVLTCYYDDSLDLEDAVLGSPVAAYGSSSSPNSGNLVVSEDDVLMLGFVLRRGSAVDGFSQDADYNSNVAPASSNRTSSIGRGIDVGDRVISAAETNNYAPTYSITVGWVAALIAYRIATSAVTGTLAVTEPSDTFSAFGSGAVPQTTRVTWRVWDDNGDSEEIVLETDGEEPVAILAQISRADQISLSLDGGTASTASLASFAAQQTGPVILGAQEDGSGGGSSDSDSAYVGLVGLASRARTYTAPITARQGAWLAPVAPAAPLVFTVPANTTRVVDIADYVQDPYGGLHIVSVEPPEQFDVLIDGSELTLLPATEIGTGQATIVLGNDSPIGATTTIIATLTVGEVIFTNGYSRRFVARLADEALVPDETLTNIPIPIVLSDSSLRSVANGGVMTSEDGGDLLIETLGGAALPYERASYDPVNGIWRGWVRLPQLSPTSENAIMIWAGKDAADPEDAANTWAGYLAVIDFPSGADLTGNGNDFTVSGVTSEDGALGPEGLFAGTASSASLSDISLITGESALTVTAIVQADNLADGDLVGVNTSDGIAIRRDQKGFGGGADNCYRMQLRSSSGLYELETPANTLKTSQQIVSLTWAAGATPKAIVDGLPQVPSWSSGSVLTGTVASSATAIRIGGGTNSTPLIGRLGKVLFAAAERNEAWEKAVYRAFRYPASFLGLGAPETSVQTARLVPIPLWREAAPDVAITIDAADLADAAGAAFSIVSISQEPSEGILEVSGTGLRYVADAGADGLDFMSVEVTSGGLTVETVITVIISATAPPPPPSGNQPIRATPGFKIYGRAGLTNFSSISSMNNAGRLSHVAYAFPSQITGNGTNDGNVDWSNVNVNDAANRIYNGRINEMRNKHGAVWLDIEGGNCNAAGWFYKVSLNGDAKNIGAVQKRVSLINAIINRFRSTVPKIEVTDYDFPAAPHWNAWRGDAAVRANHAQEWRDQMGPALDRLSFTGISAYVDQAFVNNQRSYYDWQADMHSVLAPICHDHGCKCVPTIWARFFTSGSATQSRDHCVDSGVLTYGMTVLRQAGCDGVVIWHATADFSEPFFSKANARYQEIAQWAAQNNITKVVQW